MKTKEALDIIGGLSKPSKMPCHGWSIPAKYCIKGSLMAKVPGSICSICYALKGRYVFKNVQDCLERRYNSLTDPRWVDAMVAAIIQKEKSGYFRWHDSGDLQGAGHLKMIADVCKRTPNIKHWLPTREYRTVREYLEMHGPLPDNLTVRLSGLMVDGPVPEPYARSLGVQVSGASDEGFSCPSSRQGNKCRDCRACWDKSTFNVTYKTH